MPDADTAVDDLDETVTDTTGLAADDAGADVAPRQRRLSHVRQALVVGLALVTALAALVGWLGFRAYQSHRADLQHSLFLQVGRQGAINLTAIDWQHADTDVERILNSATADDAQVLVAVSVKTSIPNAPEQNPRAWRMRVSLHKLGDDVKVANVEFVP